MAAGWSHVTPNLPRLRKSDRRIFHTKASLQKLSAKVSSVGGRQCPQGQGFRRTWGGGPHPVTKPHSPHPRSSQRGWQSTRGSWQGCRMSTASLWQPPPLTWSITGGWSCPLPCR